LKSLVTSAEEAATPASYQEIAPSDSLRRWVQCHWVACSGVGQAAFEQRVLPDGCVDLIFRVPTNRDGAAEAFLCGTMTRPFVVSANGSDWVAVRFRPGGAAAFLGVPVAQFTDGVADLDEFGFDVSVLLERLAAAGRCATPSAGTPVGVRHLSLLSHFRVGILEELLLARRPRTSILDARVQAAISVVQTDPVAWSVRQLADEVGLSRQHLTRRFTDTVGVGPKHFSRIVRMRRLVDGLEANAVQSPPVRPASNPQDWVSVALHAGYCDQSHMIREFKALVDLTPRQYLRQRAGRE
jgi:AraC-like DNA-binding protein